MRHHPSWIRALPKGQAPNSKGQAPRSSLLPASRSSRLRVKQLPKDPPGSSTVQPSSAHPAERTSPLPHPSLSCISWSAFPKGQAPRSSLWPAARSSRLRVKQLPKDPPGSSTVQPSLAHPAEPTPPLPHTSLSCTFVYFVVLTPQGTGSKIIPLACFAFFAASRETTPEGSPRKQHRSAVVGPSRRANPAAPSPLPFVPFRVFRGPHSPRDRLQDHPFGLLRVLRGFA
jgi:hypothetical protein